MGYRFQRELPATVLPLTTQQLLAEGVGRSALRGPRWRTTSRGLCVPSEVGGTPAQRSVEAVPLVPPCGALTGWAAAYAHGADYLDGLDPFTQQPLPVPIGLNTTAGRGNLTGVTFHRDRLGGAEVDTLLGLRVTTPHRTAVEGARHATNLVEAVVFLDMVGRAVEIDPARLALWCRTHPGWRGVDQLRQALRWCDVRSASPWETRLRMFYRREVGLPRPEVNVPVFNQGGDFLGTPDLLDVDAGLAVEFDGQDHRLREQHRGDNLREEKLEDSNLVVCRVDSLDLRHRGPLGERLRSAYRRGLARDRSRDRFTTAEPEWWRSRRAAWGEDPQRVRLTAEVTAWSEATTMLASMPAPQTTPASSPSPTSHSTYAAASASPPAESACSA